MEYMTPSATVTSEMTDGQIDKAVDQYRAMLRKHRSELGSSSVQHVLGQADYLSEQAAVLRTRVEAVSNMIVRRVKVDRNRTPQQALDATGRRQYVNNEAVASLPCGEGDEVDVFFFKIGCGVSCVGLDKAFGLRGLKPDPQAQAAVNEADSAFADDYPNGSQWKDADGNYTYMIVDRQGGGRRVFCGRSDVDWSEVWWFAGVRK